jgi:type IV pilus assembly protein PilX
MITRPLPQSLTRPYLSLLAAQQRGVVLLVSLLFLIVLTLIGVAASRMVTSEERQSRYLREFNTAFQASESAMRDARDDIDGILATGVKIAKPRIDLNSTFDPNCKYGLCDYVPAGQPWTVEANWANAIPYGTYSLRSPLPASAVVGTAAGTGKDADENTVARFSTTTSTSAVTGVWQQPAYLIESIPTLKGSSVWGQSNVPKTYRVTARGFGADPNSRAMVQEIVCNPAACAGL